MARANRMFVANSGTFNSPQSALAGNVYVYDSTDGETAGVPDTAAATKILVRAGETQSQKAASSISSADYYFITGLSAAIGGAGGNANRVTIRLERRDVANGGVWRPTDRNIILPVAGAGVKIDFDPIVIIPPNHDFRIRAKTDSNTADVQASVFGSLAIII